MSQENSIQPKTLVAKVFKDLDLDFTANQRSGVSKKNDLNAIKQALKILVLTDFYERPFYPTKGGNMRGMLFENMTYMMANTMAKAIQNLIETYEPRAKIEYVDVIPDYDANAYSVTIQFYGRNVNKPDRLSLELKRLR